MIVNVEKVTKAIHTVHPPLSVCSVCPTEGNKQKKKSLKANGNHECHEPYEHDDDVLGEIMQEENAET